ncbi:MAG: hypothetical protein ABR874_22645 [Candidatus Sulfotelmatobacter sp.]
MKKTTKKLELKKVTLQDLDDRSLQALAAGAATVHTLCGGATCRLVSCAVQCG